jgi:hypothetical protein
MPDSVRILISIVSVRSVIGPDSVVEGGIEEVCFVVVDVTWEGEEVVEGDVKWTVRDAGPS